MGQHQSLEPPASGREAESRRKVLSVREILGEDQEVIIKHGPVEYRLRLTSNQKLILTK